MYTTRMTIIVSYLKIESLLLLKLAKTRNNFCLIFCITLDSFLNIDSAKNYKSIQINKIKFNNLSFITSNSQEINYKFRTFNIR